MKDRRLVTDKYLKLENTYSKLPEKLFFSQYPSEVPSPKLVIFNDSLAKTLGLNERFLQSIDGIDVLCGNKILEGTTPIAQAYAGNQFGNFTMLGDGRVILLGEYISSNKNRFDIQLKGSGITPYSRGGDGKAVLGPMLREYIISEAMNALGISTTRSLAVVTTGEWIWRERELPGAILARIAKSHIRVGTFQFIANWGDIKELKLLADYTLERHFKKSNYGDNPYLYLLNEVVRMQAELTAKWQLVGFIHGVMNTDNMTISGETIDYGPCAFMDIYDPKTVFSSIDTQGRYAYENQPKIAAWNLARFAETLLPLLSHDKNIAINIAQNAILNYSNLYKKNWYEGMRKKLGLFNEEHNDKHLIKDILDIMEKYKLDYTNTFNKLTLDDISNIEIFETKEFEKWYHSWQERLERQDESIKESRNLMKKNNPVVIPRNHRVEEALDAVIKDNDYSVMKLLLDAVIDPYNYSKIDGYYTLLPNPTKYKYRTYCGT